MISRESINGQWLYVNIDERKVRSDRVKISYPIQMHIHTNLMDAFSPCYLPSHHIFLFLSLYRKPAALWLVTHRSAKRRIHAVCAYAVLDEPCELPFGIAPSYLKVSGIQHRGQREDRYLGR